MSKAEILAELSTLTPAERAEILDHLWQLEESVEPTCRERELLRGAQASYEANPHEGPSWTEVEKRLRKQP